MCAPPSGATARRRDCQVNVDLARDGVAREVFSNRWRLATRPRGGRNLPDTTKAIAAVRGRAEADREAGQ